MMKRVATVLGFVFGIASLEGCAEPPRATEYRSHVSTTLAVYDASAATTKAYGITRWRLRHAGDGAVLEGLDRAGRPRSHVSLAVRENTRGEASAKLWFRGQKVKGMLATGKTRRLAKSTLPSSSVPSWMGAAQRDLARHAATGKTPFGCAEDLFTVFQSLLARVPECAKKDTLKACIAKVVNQGGLLEKANGILSTCAKSANEEGGSSSGSSSGGSSSGGSKSGSSSSGGSKSGSSSSGGSKSGSSSSGGSKSGSSSSGGSSGSSGSNGSSSGPSPTDSDSNSGKDGSVTKDPNAKETDPKDPEDPNLKCDGCVNEDPEIDRDTNGSNTEASGSKDGSAPVEGTDNVSEGERDGAVSGTSDADPADTSGSNDGSGNDGSGNDGNEGGNDGSEGGGSDGSEGGASDGSEGGGEE